MKIKRFIKKALALVLISLSATSCLYVNIIDPLDTNVEKTNLGSKIGRSSSKCILWSVMWGDAGIQAAARNGGLTTINHLDQEYQAYFFGIYTKVTTIAYGE